MIYIFEHKSVIIEEVFFFTVFKECDSGIRSAEFVEFFVIFFGRKVHNMMIGDKN